MAEYIPREAVIDLITRRYENPEICTQEINQIPSADVAPVVHGEWVEEKYQTISASKRRTINNTKNCCSVCGNSNGRVKTSYCPHCGAKMDGGEKDAQVPT